MSAIDVLNKMSRDYFPPERGRLSIYLVIL